MAKVLVESVGAEIEVKTSGSAKSGATKIGKGRLGMLMAACGDSSFMDKVSLPFASMDMRGFGKSTVKNDAEADFGLESYLQDFGRVIKRLKIKKPVLVGYSHAGYFVTQYAMANPGSVGGLILIEPALFTSREELERRAKLAEQGNGDGAIQAMLQYVDSKKTAKKSAAKSAVKTINRHVQNDRTLAMEFRIRAENPVSNEDLKKLKMPVLLVGGTASDVREMVERAANHIPSVSVFWIQGATHLDFWNNKEFADDVAMVVSAFARQL